MIIERASFIHPIAPANGVDGTMTYVTAQEAELKLEPTSGFLRVIWKTALRDARGWPADPATVPYRLVPLTNVRELQCVSDDPATAPTQPNARVPKPEPGPKPKAR
jgi:hypothetical protein